MTNAVNTRYSYNEKLFLQADDEPKYKIGYEATVIDDEENIPKIFIYMKTNVYCEAFLPKQIQKAYEPDEINSNGLHMKIVVPQYDILQGQYGWFQYQGKCQCRVKTTTVPLAIDDYLKSDTDVPNNLERVGQDLTATSLATSKYTMPANTTQIGTIILMGRVSKTAT